MFRIRWRYAPFRRTEMFTWCWEVGNLDKQGDGKVPIPTAARWSSHLQSSWRPDIASWGCRVQEGASKVRKIHYGTLTSGPDRMNFSPSIGTLFTTLKLFIVVNLKIWQRPPWFIIVFAIHNAFVTCINSKTAICKHTLQYIPSGNQTWKWRVPIYRLFSMLTSFGDLLLDECRIILSTWCAPWWCGEMLSWARFSAQFLHVQYVLSCVDFIKDVQPKDIRNLISSDEMHSQAGDTELVLWKTPQVAPFEGETSHFGAGVGHDACSLGATAAVHEGTRCDELDGSGSKFHTQGTRTCWFDT